MCKQRQYKYYMQAKTIQIRVSKDNTNTGKHRDNTTVSNLSQYNYMQAVQIQIQ